MSVRTVCITGPESTGKTTLAELLARALNSEWVPEAARCYAERAARPLTVADVAPIAREHIEMADAALARASEKGSAYLVLDTDLLSTVAYARHYYEASPHWIEQTALARLADLYVLCDVDVPWVPDGVRDLPHAREAMLAEFAGVLREFRASIVEVYGTPEERVSAVLFAMRT
jgi:NadR type nicotinamide-nucleotide adenylyltransferase